MKLSSHTTGLNLLCLNMSRPIVFLDVVPYESAFHWRNDPQIYTWCRQHTIRSMGQHQEYWAKVDSEHSSQFYGIYVAKQKNNIFPVGVCGFTGINWISRVAEFSLYISVKHQRQGYAKEAIKDLFSRGFYEFGLNRIWGETFEGNPALTLFESIGMKQEGKLRHHYFKNGKLIDAHIMGILREEWDAGHSTCYLNHVLYNPSRHSVAYTPDS